MIVLDENHIILNLKVDKKEDAIREIVTQMVKTGHVLETYYDDVMEREAVYPTGLPTDDVGVAIPHANSSHVLKPGVGLAVVQTPVEFGNMADPKENIRVKIIFLLANKNADDQLGDLQRFMKLFSQNELLMNISHANNKRDIIDMISNIE
jgi:PTS system galactitol-specific IIA component